MTPLPARLLHLGALVVVAVALVADVTPVAARSLPRVDITALTLPAEEPDAARAAVRCELAAPEVCGHAVATMLALPFAWHRTGYTFVLLPEPSPDLEGVVASGTPTGVARKHGREVELYLPPAPPGHDAAASSALQLLDRTVAHEVGHTFHQSCDERALFRGWRSARGIPRSVPDRGHGDSGHHSVAEDLAEAAMVWLLGGHHPSRSTVPSAPLTDGTLDELAPTYFRSCPGRR